MTDTIPFRRVVAEIDARAGDMAESLELLSVSQQLGVIPRNSITDKEPRAEDLTNYKRCWPGDLVLNRMSAYQGALGLARQGGIVSPDYAVLRSGAAMEPRFLAYLMKSQWFVGEMTARLRGIGSPGTGSVRTPRVNVEDLGTIELPLPSVEEQRRIADFLDDQVARIDALIALHRTGINLLKELTGSTITSIVAGEVEITGGSLAERSPWLEGTATAWPTAPLRRLVRSGVSGAAPIKGTVAEEWESGLFPGYSASGQDVWLRDDQATFTGPGLVVSAVGARCGKVFLADDRWGVTANTAVLLPRTEFVDARFLWRVVDNSAFWTIGGSAQPYVQMDRSLDAEVPLPPVEEQRRIADLLDDFVDSVRRRVDLEENCVTLLEERKRALITAAVTGELDVTTAKPVGMGKWVPNVGASVEAPAAAQASGIGGIG